ncbi:MAG: signal peptidase I [Deltaproteobacteria bacterium]|nr:signal peptidase I [Deltaproteobacteria bacterium]MBW2446455.1 signal peptidase I [Deltaproteobacteria bacterium]
MSEPADGQPEAGANPSFWEQFGSLLLAVAIALGVRTFVVEPFRIPSESMLPTLLVGDHLFVNKFAYGVKIPFTETRLPGLRGPERGDVVVFTVARDPRNPGRICPVDRCPGKPTEEFVKRIVGLPGETVEVRPDGTVRIDGRLLERGDGGADFINGVGTELAVRDEDNGRCHYQVLDDRRMTGAVRRVKVEPDRYFMMGDNRDHSNDSRGWGTVRASEFKGPALLLYWSWDYNEGWLDLLNPLTWLRAEKRWDRFGDGLTCEARDAGEGGETPSRAP